MTPFLAEFMGTALILAIGTGVVANVLLDKTKGQNGGVVAVTLGWGFAVFVGVYTAASSSGAHLNPVVTIALASIGKIEWAMVPNYLLAQLLGAMAGSFVAWLAYRKHLDITNDAAIKLAVFATGPAIRNTPQNLLTECIASFVFMLGVLFITKGSSSLGALDALPVALLVLAVGLGLGGPTGYAINPARDLGPRIMHAILPIKNKGGSDWSYSWIPIVGPILGGVLAAWVWQYLQ